MLHVKGMVSGEIPLLIQQYFFSDPIILEKPLALRKSLIKFKNSLFVVTHFSVILARCCFMHCLR